MPQCIHVRENGTQCKLFCKPGYTKCKLHGGATPAAKRKAEEAMAILRFPAIEGLHDLLNQLLSDTCPACGFPKLDVDKQRTLLATCKAILDRTGFGPSQTVRVEQGDGPVDLTLLSPGEREDLRRALSEVRRIKLLLHDRQNGTVKVVNGAVITSGPPAQIPAAVPEREPAEGQGGDMETTL